MKRILLIITIILLNVLTTASTSYSSDLIPPYHWTYHSLEILSDKDLIKEKVIPGQSTYTKEQVAKMVIAAMDKIRKDPSLMGENELYSMRQLVNGYKKELEINGKNFGKMKKELENLAITAHLTAKESSEVRHIKERLLSFEAAGSVNKFTFDIYRHLAAKDNEAKLNSDPSFVKSEIQRTQQVIDDRKSAGRCGGFRPDAKRAICPNAATRPIG